MNLNMVVSKAGLLGIMLGMMLMLAACSQKETTPAPPPAATEQPPAQVQVNASAEQNTSPAPASQPEPTPVPSAPESKSVNHIVNLIDGGFEQNNLTINAGDTVTWQNIREKQPDKALIVGAQKCSEVKSPVFYPGEVFKWTFTLPVSCLIVDGIFTTKTMKLVVK